MYFMHHTYIVLTEMVGRANVTAHMSTIRARAYHWPLERPMTFQSGK